MKVSARSSITLAAEDIVRIKRLKRCVGVKTNIGVVRCALALLEEATARAALRHKYREASDATLKSLADELAELDHLTAEALGE